MYGILHGGGHLSIGGPIAGMAVPAFCLTLLI